MKTIINGISYLLLLLVVTVVALTIFVSSSSRVIEWVAKTYAPQYGFSYNRISGTLISGVEVEQLSFKGDRLLDSFKFGWNPALILYDKVAITHLEIRGVEVEAIEKTAKAFSSKEDKAEEDNSSFVMPIAVGIDKLYIGVNAFEKNGIEVNKISLEVENILFKELLDIDKILLKVDTNISQITFDGGLKDGIVKVSTLALKEIDTLAIRQIIDSLKQDDTNTTSNTTATTQEPSRVNPLMPILLEIDKIDIEIKPVKFPEVNIDRASLQVESLKVDILKLLVKESNAIEVAKVMLVADTNLTNIYLDTSLKDEEIIVNKLSVLEIDTLALTKIFASQETNATVTKEDNTTTINPLIPKQLLLKEFNGSIKKAFYDPVKIESVELKISSLAFDIINLVAQDGDIELNANSNLARVNYSASIEDNKIKSRGLITPLKELFKTYNLRDGGIEPIKFSLDANQTRVDAEVLIDGSKILLAKEGEFNIENLHFVNSLIYLISDKKLTIENRANIATPYAKDILLDNFLVLENNNFTFKGSLLPGKLEVLDSNQSKPLQDLTITYEGNNSSIEAYIDSSELQGKLVSSDFKSGEFNLSTKKLIELNQLLSLPPKFQKAKVGININAPLDLVNMTTQNATIEIISNLANINATVDYYKSIIVKAKSYIPSNSLLRDFDKALNIDAFTPLNINLSMVEDNINANIVSEGLTSTIKYISSTKDLNGNLVIAKENFSFGGNLEKSIILNHNISSIENLIKRVQTLYAFEDPKIDGDAKISISLTKMKELELKLTSNKLLFRVDRKTVHTLDDTMVSLGFVESNLTLQSYHTTFQEQKIFATKPSIISLKDNVVKISPLWLNDALKVTGQYSIADKKGKILVYADDFGISHKMIDLNSSININTKIDGVKTDINGKVTLLGGRVYLDMDKKSFATDSDIIIIKNIKKKKPSAFMDNLMLSLFVDTRKPLVYKTNSADIKLKVDVVIQQVSGSPLEIYGTASIVDGSYYIFQEKKFVLKDSIIALTGDTSKPILDISAIYNSLNYEIKIQVTGDPQTPNIIFSSIPSLTREQILSVILFDNEDAGDSSSGDDMMKMMGGAMAKAALSGVGIKIDHLSLGTDGSMEVGKKISDKVTIIYVNDEVSSARLQYDWTKNIKASILSDGESSGADIVYRREF